MNSSDGRDRVYCTWVHRKILPKGISDGYRDLDHFVKTLLANAKRSVLIISPYLTPDGIDLVKDSIYLSAKRNVWIRIVVGDSKDAYDFNKLALQRLVSGDQGRTIRERLRILRGSKDLSILLHSKIITIDAGTGYLGSANFSFSAFEKNFEVGVELSGVQAESIEELVSYWESTGLLLDCTDDSLDAV